MRSPLFNNITGVILAGGESKRMGRDKATLEFSGDTLIKKTVHLFKLLFPTVIVISKKRDHLKDLDCEVVEDILPERGAMIGILTAFRESAEESIFVAACDMPFLNKDVISYIISEGAGFDAALPVVAGKKHPLHALYSRAISGPMLEVFKKGEKSLNAFIDSLAPERVRLIGEDEIKKIDAATLSLFNMNTQEELEKAKKILLKKPGLPVL